MNSTNANWKDIARLRETIQTAEAIIIGAGAGLSTSAGFSYSGRRFKENFPDFIAKYGFSDMYSAGFYPYETLEEHWAYWSRYIFINRYQNPPKPVYQNLFHLVQSKDYFVLTTNVDHCFQKAGFDKQRLFYTQGDYGLWQCQSPAITARMTTKRLSKEWCGNRKRCGSVGIGAILPALRRTHVHESPRRQHLCGRCRLGQSGKQVSKFFKAAQWGSTFYTWNWALAKIHQESSSIPSGT